MKKNGKKSLSASIFNRKNTLFFLLCKKKSTARPRACADTHVHDYIVARFLYFACGQVRTSDNSPEINNLSKKNILLCRKMVVSLQPESKRGGWFNQNRVSATLRNLEQGTHRKDTMKNISNATIDHALAVIADEAKTVEQAQSLADAFAQTPAGEVFEAYNDYVQSGGVYYDFDAVERHLPALMAAVIHTTYFIRYGLSLCDNEEWFNDIVTGGIVCSTADDIRSGAVIRISTDQSDPTRIQIPVALTGEFPYLLDSRDEAEELCTILNARRKDNVDMSELAQRMEYLKGHKVVCSEHYTVCRTRDCYDDDGLRIN